MIPNDFHFQGVDITNRNQRKRMNIDWWRLVKTRVAAGFVENGGPEKSRGDVWLLEIGKDRHQAASKMVQELCQAKDFS